MALDIFRRKQKTIFWIVAIVVIPSFILYGASSWNQGGSDPVVMEVNGRSVRYGELQDLWRRFQAVTGRPVFITAPVRDDRYRDLWSGALTLAYLDAAREAGLAVSEAEIGTFIRQDRAFEGSDGRFDPDRYRKVIQSRNVNHREYSRGIRELLLIDTYRRLLTSGIQPTDETDYLAYAWQNTRCAYGKASVPMDHYLEDEPEALSLPEEEAQDAIRLYYETHRDYPGFREPARWRFEYILVPYEGFTVEINEREVGRFYRQHVDEYEGASLDEVREEVTADYVAARRKELALTTITNLLEREILQALEQGEVVDAQTLVDDPTLQRRGVRTGDSGPSAMPATEFHRIPEIGDSPDLQQYFRDLNEELTHLKEESAEAYQARLKELPNAFDRRPEPMQSEAGAFRVRVLEYQPPRVKALDEPGVKVAVLNEMRREEAFDRAQEAAETLAATIEADGPDAVDLETIEATYPTLPETLLDASLGDPRIRQVPSGYEVLVLTRRAPPTREAWDAQQPVVRQFRRQYLAREIADVRLHAWKVDAMQSGRVRLVVRDRE